MYYVQSPFDLNLLDTYQDLFKMLTSHLFNMLTSPNNVLSPTLKEYDYL